MSALLQDARIAIRMLAKRPGFAAVAVITLALGLSVNVTVFSLVSDFFLRPLPAKDPEQLVVIVQKSAQFRMPYPFSYPDFEDFRHAVEGAGSDASDMARAFSGMMAYKEEVVHISRAGTNSERTWVHAASGNYFNVLGVQPFLGRLFLPGEGRQPGADPIIVLTHDAWRDRFASDSRLIGQSIKLNGLPFTVVGVTPPGFVGAAWNVTLSGFVPATMLPQLSPAHGEMIHQRGNTGFFMVGRLQKSTSLDEARAAIDVLMARLITSNPEQYAPQAKALVLRESMSRPSPFVATLAPMIVSALMMMAVLVLAVAAANVAGLLLARAADRQRELAIRGALGASRWQLLRQLLVESVLLALSAAAMGMVAALFVVPRLASIGPGGDFAPSRYAGLDFRLFAFAFGAALVTGTFMALLSALKATRPDVMPHLKEATGTPARERHLARSALVVAQVAVSCIVLTITGLALRSLYNLSKVPMGFQPENLLLARYDLGLQRYSVDEGRRFHARLLEKVRAMPGVRDASLADQVPFDVGGSFSGDITAEGSPEKDDAETQFTLFVAAERAFLATTGFRMVAGRDFSIRDDATAPRVAIVDRLLARHLWPGENPLGRCLVSRGMPLEVIGIVSDARYWSITDRARPLIFVPLAQHYSGRVTLVARTTGDSAPLMSSIRQAAHSLDPDLPLHDLRTMNEQIASSPMALMPLRVGSMIAGIQSAIALSLATLGVFGLVTFAAAKRTREIGIRVAMGARSVDVIRLVSIQSLRLAFIGLVCGLLLSLALARVLAPLLYEVSPTDAVALGGAVSVVVVATALASWLPVRRAAMTNPVKTLRAE
ncbi:MAG: ABC transporter permease [Vicinamibacteria bacterium]|nr:ABC transporter permease [Vicinamibacteria bacterium]